jgi:sn-glycerol 3-phosphate transport system substrate-binding protein
MIFFKKSSLENIYLLQLSRRLSHMPLTFYHSLGGLPGASLYEIVQYYNKDHTPTVELVSDTTQNYAAASSEALRKTPEERPNFILAPEYMTGTLQEAFKDDKMISVSKLLDEDKLDDIANIVKKTFGIDCLPFNPSCGVLYINKRLLKEGGLSSDWKPISLEELIDAANKIKEKTGISHGYTCAWPEAYLVEMVLAQKNHSLLDEKGNYNFIQLGEHVSFLRELVQEKMFLAPEVGNYDHTRDSFIQGKVAFYMQGSGHSKIIEEKAKAADFEVGYAPLPTLSKDQEGTTKYALPLGGAASWVFKTRNNENNCDTLSGLSIQKEVEGVREFLNYLASKEIQTQWHKDTAYVPVSNSVRKSLHDFYKDHPLHEAVVVQTLDAPISDNSFGIKKINYPDIRKQLYPLIRGLLYLEGSSEEVNKIIIERLEAFEIESNKKS